MYSLSRHARRASILRPTGYGSGSMLLHGHPVRCMVHPLGTISKEMKKEDLQETHDHQVKLRADVKKLGKMLGYAISKHSGEGVFQKVRTRKTPGVRGMLYAEWVGDYFSTLLCLDALDHARRG